MCHMCECYRGGIVAICDLASTLCKYDFRKGATSEAGKYFFRAANV